MWYVKHMWERKEVLTQATTWMDLEDTTPRAISQPQKDKYCVTPLTCGPRSSEIHRGRKQKGGCRGRGGRWGVSVSWGQGVSFVG